MRLTALLCALMFVSPAFAKPTTRPFAFQITNGGIYDAFLDVPDDANKNGVGVIIIPSIPGTDADWTIPAPYTIDQDKDIRDGKRLGQMLASRGFTVLRMDMYARGQEPTSSRPPQIPFGDTLEATRKGLAAFRALNLCDPERIVVIGHGLGTLRASELLREDEGVIGAVLLSGGALARTGYETDQELTEDANRKFRQMDFGNDRQVDEGEYRRYRQMHEGEPIARRSFEELDRDGDGVLLIPEVAGTLAVDSHRLLGDSVSRPWTLYDLTWPEDVLNDRDVPTLAVYGSRDQRSAWAYILEASPRTAEMADFEVRVYPDVGHLLGPQQFRKVGPMSDEIATGIVEWVDERFGAADADDD